MRQGLKKLLYKVVESHHKPYLSVAISQFYQNGNTSYFLVNTLCISENKIGLPNATSFRLRKTVANFVYVKRFA